MPESVNEIAATQRPKSRQRKQLGQRQRAVTKSVIQMMVCDLRDDDSYLPYSGLQRGFMVITKHLRTTRWLLWARTLWRVKCD